MAVVFLVFLGDVWATPLIRHMRFLWFAFISAYSSCRIMLHKQKKKILFFELQVTDVSSFPFVRRLLVELCTISWRRLPFCCFSCSPAITAFRSESVPLYCSWHAQKKRRQQMLCLYSELLLVVVNLLVPLESRVMDVGKAVSWSM